MLRSLLLHDNRLVGAVPAELAALTNLELVTLERNPLARCLWPPGAGRADPPAGLDIPDCTRSSVAGPPPELGPSQRIEFAGGVSAERQAELRAAVEDVAAFYALGHGIGVPDFRLYVAPDGETARALSEELTGFRRPFAGPGVAGTVTATAEGPVRDHQGRDFPPTDDSMDRLLSHEYYHLVQHDAGSRETGAPLPVRTGWWRERPSTESGLFIQDKYGAQAHQEWGGRFSHRPGHLPRAGLRLPGAALRRRGPGGRVAGEALGRSRRPRPLLGAARGRERLAGGVHVGLRGIGGRLLRFLRGIPGGPPVGGGAHPRRRRRPRGEGASPARRSAPRRAHRTGKGLHTTSGRDGAFELTLPPDAYSIALARRAFEPGVEFLYFDLGYDAESGYVSACGRGTAYEAGAGEVIDVVIRVQPELLRRVDRPPCHEGLPGYHVITSTVTGPTGEPAAAFDRMTYHGVQLKSVPFPYRVTGERFDGLVESHGVSRGAVQDGRYLLEILYHFGFYGEQRRLIGWYGSGGFTTDRDEARVIEVQGASVDGIEVRLPADPEELPRLYR